MFNLNPLSFTPDALEPQVSAQTIGFHYGKHHQAYVDNLNKFVTGTDLAGQSLEEIILATANNPDQAAIFNNAAQVYNHNFYWQSLAPQGGQPGEKLAQMIAADFGSYEKFQEEFLAAAVGQFGSGWAWLVLAGDKLKIVKTANAGTPLASGQKPLLVIDVWEHAYYLDYQNRRLDYVKALIAHNLNWTWAEAQLAI